VAPGKRVSCKSLDSCPRRARACPYRRMPRSPAGPEGPAGPHYVSGASWARTGDPLLATRSSVKPNQGKNTADSLVERTICRSWPTSIPEAAGAKRPSIGPKWTPGWQPRTQQIWCVQPLRTARLLPGTLARRGWRAPLTTCAPPQADPPGGTGPSPSPSLLIAAQAEDFADREFEDFGDRLVALPGHQGLVGSPRGVRNEVRVSLEDGMSRRARPPAGEPMSNRVGRFHAKGM
jgi:hypothetical protein